MGLFDFIRKAGKKIGIGDAEASEDKAPPAEAIKKEIEDLGLPADKVDVSVKDDEVTLRGEEMGREMREKVIVAAGNILGVGKVRDEIKRPTDDAEEPVFHVVQKGETLWGIAAKELGDGARYQEIFEANRPMLSDPDKIYPGQTLRIPK